MAISASTSPVVKFEIEKLLAKLMVDGKLEVKVTLEVIEPPKPVESNSKSDSSAEPFGFAIMD